MSDITPDTHFLESIRADRGSYWTLAAEAIDNAFDAGATEAALSLNKEWVGLKDNGQGITRDRELSMVRLGEHRAMPTTALGTFGIGMKYHAVSAGDVLEVSSVSTDGRMRLSADWGEIIRMGAWRIADPKWVSSIHAGKTGTEIKISRLRWPAPTAKDIKQAHEKLSQIFYPALIAGRIITLNRENLPLLREPEMTNVVEGDVRLPNGKGAHVRGGITTSPSSLYQVQVSYKHRVIMPQSVFGCGSYTGLRRMFARVELTGPWTLERFKNRLADNDADELQNGVEEILLPVLEQCHGAQMSVRVNEMTELVNDMLPPELIPARPISKGNKSGPSKTKRPTRIHGKTKDGDENPSGPARKLRTGAGLVVSFEEPLVDEHGFGHFTEGKPNRVTLAMDNPLIASLLASRDQVEGARQIITIALFIFHNELDKQTSTPSFPELNGKAGFEVWQMVKQQNLGTADIAVA